MRKKVFGRQFSRDVNERKALFKSLLSSLVLNEQIKTTEAKAKAIRGAADKLVTKARRGGLQAYRLLQPELNGDAVKKMVSDIAPRFTARQGGYTRIIRLERRFSDNAQMVVMEWVEKPALPVPSQTEKSKKAKLDKKESEKPTKEEKIKKEAKVKKTTKKATKKETKKK